MPRVKVPGFLSRSNASHRKGAKHRTALLATVALLAGMIPAALVFNAASAGADGGAPTIQSDFADYNPGQTVTLTGANWDSAGSPVHIVVNDSDGYTWQHTADVSPAAVGTIQDIFKLSTSFISHYSVEASQLAADGTTTLRASSSFTDANPSASLDQCANDPVPSSNTDGCSAAASDWVNGNLGASKAVYLEGDSIPYRMTFGSLSLSSHTVTIEWDTTKSGTHALDYLTTFNRTVATANPCLGVSPCNSPTTFPIPADPQVTRLRRRQVGSHHAYLHRDPGKPSPRVGRPHLLAARLGLRQLGDQYFRLSIPHAPHRSGRIGRQPGPVAVGRGRDLPRVDHGHQGRDPQRPDELRLHGFSGAADELQPRR